MADLWPWLALAGLGALHGLSPTGWMFAAACGVRAGDAAQARRALGPIAIGHVASVALVAWAVAQGLAIDPAAVRVLAGALLVGFASIRTVRSWRSWLLSRSWGSARGSRPGGFVDTPVGHRAGHAGIAGWSFLMATVHGAGLMLVPALAPLCLAANPARAITASGSLGLAAAAVAVHTAAMLLATGVVATAVCRGVVFHARLMRGAVARHAWSAALAVTGVLLIVLRSQTG